MTTSTDVQFVQPYASIHPQIGHMPEHRCVTVRAHDDAKNFVVLYFHATDDADELAVAEAWLRDALAKVEVATMLAANDQPAPVDHNAARTDWYRYLYEGGTADFQTWWERYKGDYARIGEPLDLTAGAL